jgi:diazepam-binding inhibitor (GABA receptor modulator, acyl-CoA-binding protein)
MADLDSDFSDAVARVTELPTDPGNDVKLRLYALYKQATVGDAEGKRPGFTNPVARAKHDAWSSTAGMSADDAKRAYVDLVTELRGR